MNNIHQLIEKCPVNIIYKEGVLNPAKLIAGESGLSKYISWFHIVEVVEDFNIFHGNELLITTGFNIGDDPDLQVELLENLSRKNLSALLIKKGYYITEISDKAIERSNELSLPLFSIDINGDIISISQKLSSFLMQFDKWDLASSLFNALIENKIINSKEALGDFNLLGFDNYPRHIIVKVDVESNSKSCNISVERETKSNNISNKLMEHFLSYFGHEIPIIFKGESIIALVPCKNNKNESIWKWANTFLESIKEELTDFDVKIGVSNCFTGLNNLAKHLGEAELAIDIMRKVNTNSNIGFFYKLLPYYMLTDLKNTELIHEYFSLTIEPLLNHDKRFNNDLFNTLKTFIKNDGNILNTARKLFIHRNSLYYRLKKIRQILDIQLDSFEDKFLVDLAMRLHDLNLH
ncbi:MAG: PucR family transcriptional regulator ligand-binding domain-containing protein [Actinobacteria bacterium]|nr:PucR family transcriptional regulator ligand-binding domain-containing protein [Actinomycetota bacterium]